MASDSRFYAPDSALAPIRAYVGIGSNLGDRAGNLLLAVRGMMNAGLCVACLSSIYETEPVDVREQPAFLNMVAELKFEPELRRPIPTPEQVLARLLRIEYALGRHRDVPRGPRTIDLDLLLYGNRLRATELLKLPHPRLHQRRFVLVPLAEIAPQAIHPTLHQTVSDLLAQTDDHSEVKRWTAQDADAR
ncbi:MAG TPA: 2-amino-4-hydroxy-6-hydroxymethyldihydropteridine diphosphokinase [Pyrinomonadaceae bacterium]|jgi:2-amino-4-hydroxy-6-hydroxymethyldihydropteridine diphosphokinase